MATSISTTSGTYTLVRAGENALPGGKAVNFPSNQVTVDFFEQAAKEPSTRAKLVALLGYAQVTVTDRTIGLAVANEIDSGKLRVFSEEPYGRLRAFVAAVEAAVSRARQCEMREDIPRMVAQEPADRERGDYKIVVEVPPDPNKELLGELRLTSAGKTLPAMDSFVEQRGSDDKRSQIDFSDIPNKPRDLLYVLPRTGCGGSLVLPLARNIEPVTKSTEKGQWDNILVPVLPLRYLEKTDSGFLGARLLRTGWVYIYLNGKLWREIKVVNKKGSMRDVDLETEGGKDIREASSRNHRYFLLPYKLKGEKQTVEIAFSDVQWPWSYICEMGGLASEADDPRFPKGCPARKKAAGIKADDGMRSQRMEKIDFGSYPKFPVAGTTMVLAAPEEVPLFSWAHSSELNALRATDRNVVVTFVRDAVGIASSLHDEYVKLHAEYIKYADDNKRGKAIADVVKSLIFSDTSYMDHVRGEYYDFPYDTDADLMARKRKRAMDNFVAYCDGPEMKQTQEDFKAVMALKTPPAGDPESEEVKKQKVNIETIEAKLKYRTSDLPEGRRFVVKQLRDKTSILSVLLTQHDKAVAVTTSLFQSLATPLGEMGEEGMELMKTILTNRKLMESLTLKETGYVGYLGGKKVSLGKHAAAASIPTTLRPMAAEPPMPRVKYAVAVWSDDVLNNPVFKGVVGTVDIIEGFYVLSQLPKNFKQANGTYEVLKVLLAAGSAVASGGVAVAEAATVGLTLRYGSEAAAVGLSKAAAAQVVKVGLILNVIQFFVECSDAVVEAKSGDLDAAGAKMVMAAGAYISILGAAAAFPPALLIGALVSVAGAVIYAIVNDEPIEDWMRGCYWGKGQFQQMVAVPDQKSIDSSTWKNKPEAELEALYRILYPVKVEAAWIRNDTAERAVRKIFEQTGRRLHTPDNLDFVVSAGGHDPRMSKIHCELRLKMGGEWHTLLDKEILKTGLPPDIRISHLKPSGGSTRIKISVLQGGRLDRAEEAEVTVWYDPQGNGSIMRPSEKGVTQKVTRGRRSSSAG